MKSTTLALVIPLAAFVLCFREPARAADISDAASKSIIVNLKTVTSDHRAQKPKSDDPPEPARPDSTGLASDVKQVVTTFEQARDTFVAQQKELTTQLKGAAEDDREKIREELKKNLDQFVTQREQFRDQLKEASDKLRAYAKKLKDESEPSKTPGKPRGG